MAGALVSDDAAADNDNDGGPKNYNSLDIIYSVVKFIVVMLHEYKMKVVSRNGVGCHSQRRR